MTIFSFLVGWFPTKSADFVADDSAGGFSYLGTPVPTALHEILAVRHDVLILSEIEAAEFQPPSPEKTIMIRIASPGQDLPPLTGTYREVLICRFFDLESALTDQETFRSKAYLEIQTEARWIRKFISKYKAEKMFTVIHCQMGISRSSAVATYILESRGDQSGANFVQNTDENVWKPNVLVLRALRNRVKGEE